MAQSNHPNNGNNSGAQDNRSLEDQVKDLRINPEPREFVVYREIPLFDPDDPRADLRGWCRYADRAVAAHDLTGAELLITIAQAVRGRASALVAQFRGDMEWPEIREMLFERFDRPMLMADYFEEIMSFRIGGDHPIDAAIRLWDMVFNIPDIRIEEHVQVGIVVAVLRMQGNYIRKHLNPHVITTKAQLFHVLSGIVVRPDNEDDEAGAASNGDRGNASANDSNGCYYCGDRGHSFDECRNRPGQSSE